MLPPSTHYPHSPFKSHENPVIFTLYSPTYSEEDFNNKHDFINRVLSYDDFSEMIENMFEWNVMDTLGDGDQIFYIKDDMEEDEEMIEDEMMEENRDHKDHKEQKDHVNIFENLSNEEITVEEEEVIEMSGVSIYEECYDIETKFIKERFVNYGVSGACPLSENRQNRRENLSRDDKEDLVKCIKECQKINAQKSKDRKRLRENRINRNQEAHEPFKGNPNMQDVKTWYIN